MLLIPIAEKHGPYCRETAAKLKEAGLRVEIADTNNTLNKKIRNGQGRKIPYLLVAGDQEIEKASVNVRPYGSQDQTVMAVGAFIEKCRKQIGEHR